VADFDLSMVIKADGSQAASEGQKFETSLEGIAEAQERVAATAGDMKAATTSASAATEGQASASEDAARAALDHQQAMSKLATELAAVKAQLGATVSSLDAVRASEKLASDAAATLRTAQAALSTQLNDSQQTISALTTKIDVLETRLSKLGGTGSGGGGGLGGVAKGSAQARASMQDLGYQVSDLGTSILSGNGILRSFTQQSGQVAFALSGMGGTAGKIGTFFAGPWGAAILIAGEALSIFIPKLLESSSETEKLQKRLDAAVQSADSFGNAESQLGKIIDLTTGKLKTHNQVLLQTVLLQQQLNLANAQKTIDAAGKPKTISGSGSSAAASGGGIGGQGSIDAAVQADKLADAQQKAYDAIKSALAGTVSNNALANSDPQAFAQQVGGALKLAISNLDQIARSGKVAGKSLTDAKLDLIALAQAGTDKAAALEAISVIGGGPVPDDLKPYAKDKKPRKPKKAPDTSGLVNSVTNDIATITAQFTDAPTFVEKADAAVRKLDQDIAALQKKKPPNFQSLIDQAEAAKDIIRDNIAKPYNDFIKDQQQSFEVSKLAAEGHTDEANALKVIFTLQKQMGPLTDQQKQGVLDTVQALRQEQAAQEALTKSRQQDLDALGKIQTSIEGLFTGTTKIADIPKQIQQAFRQLAGQQLFDKLFDGALSKLKDQINGVSTVQNASDKMASAISTTIKPLDDLASAAKGAADAVSGQASLIAGTSRSQVSSLAGDAKAFIGANDNLFSSDEVSSANEIVVTASKQIKSASTDFLGAVDLFNKSGKSFGASLDKLVDPGSGFFSKLGSQLGNVLQGFTLGSTGGKAGGVVGALSGLLKDGSVLGTSGIGGSITSLAGSVSSFLPAYAAGQTIDNAIAPIIKGLGVKYSKTGQAIGGLLGGIIGGLFKKSKKGGATITDTTGDATTFGNSASREATAGTLAGNVQSGIEQIAQQLGGIVGSFSGITIGQYKDKYRVNTVSNKLGGSSSPVAGLTSYDTPEEAVSAAIQAAIAKGAVSGLDAAVQKALGSSSDIDKALTEALNVQKVEALIGGVGYALKQTFETFDAQAKANLDIAKKYGLDVVALEKATADQRTKLISDTLKQSVGSLQDFLDSVKYGDLADGSASDKRQALLDKISDTKKLADTGDQDAINQLADLYQQLVSTSKDAFGTAGPEYSSDKNLAVTGAQQVIQMETDRINQAAGAGGSSAATTAAVQANNDLTNETNDLLARQNTTLGNILGALQGAQVSGGMPVISITARPAVAA